jgi:hypoxanthine phosphoribosyltransferase
MNSNAKLKVMISEEEIQSKVAELAGQLSSDYIDKDPVIIGILKGAFYFTADLTRKMTIPLNVDFLAIGMQPATTSQTAVVGITKDLDISIVDRHVVLVEDIIDTGLTMGYLYQNMEARKPASIKICTLLDKPSLRLVDMDVAYTGFTIPDVTVVGYGLDYNENYRHLPYIAELTV